MWTPLEVRVLRRLNKLLLLIPLRKGLLTGWTKSVKRCILTKIIMQKKIHDLWSLYKGLIIILLLAFLVRGLFLFLVFRESGPSGFAPRINEDASEYVSLAKNLSQYGIFSREDAPPLTPERLRTPGFPLFLSFFYFISPRLTFLTAAQNVFFLLAIILLYKIVLAITASKKTALLASGFLALEPATLYWNSQLTTESLFTLAILVSFFCFILFLKQLKLKFIFYSGFFLGFALLTRPITQYLYLIFLGGTAVIGFLEKINRKKIIFGIIIFLFGYALVVSPWMIRNKILFGTTSVSTMNVGFGKYVRAIHEELGIYVDYTRFGGQERSEVERLAIVRADAIRTIVRHPIIFAKIHLSGALPFFLGDGYVTALGAISKSFRNSHVVTNWTGNPRELIVFLRGHQGLEGIIFWIGKLVWFVVTIAAVIGIWISTRARGRERRVAALIFIIIYYFVLASGVGSYSRFRFPVNPFIFYFAAAGIIFLKERLIAKKLFFGGK